MAPIMAENGLMPKSFWETLVLAVTWLPFTVCCWRLEITEPLEYRPDSHLLIVHGSLNEKASASEIHYFDFNGRRFAPIAPSIDSR